MTPKILGNTKLTHFDCLVVGSGCGGAAVANVLCAAGLDVLVLEAGANRYDGLDDATRQPTTTFSNDELKMSYRSFIWPDPVVEPRTWRNDPSQGDRTFVGEVNPLPKTVGGGGVHADLKMPRFEPFDFQMGSLMKDVAGASFADWPVSYDELEPFYVYVERVMGVQGLAGANPFEGPRSAPYPMPPGVPMYVGLKVSEGAKKLGYTPFPYPASVNSMPYDGRPACVDCGYCSGYVCPSHAKSSPAVTTLRRALTSGHCLLLAETRVTKLLVNSTGTMVTGVETIGPDGTKKTYSADRYVLAASPIEDARLLLLSDGVGNSSGLVGRNLMFHLQTNAIGIFDERMHGHRGRTVSHGFADFRGKPNDPNRPLGGIVEISGSEFPVEEGHRYADILFPLGAFEGRLFKKLLRQSPGRDRIVALAMQAEDAPQSTNVVDLDPAVRDLDGLPVARITYANHPYELSASDFYRPKLLELLLASGARYAIPAPRDAIPASAHVMGTLRFGDDPKTSVCDRTGKLHDLGNVWAADGALFPTSSGYNPTLTLVALATWVAGQIAYPGAPEKALAGGLRHSPIGNRTVNVVPSLVEVTAIAPPCARTMSFAM